MIFINEHWRQTLVKNNLQTFKDIWQLEVKWVEEPNIRRGGWSGVSKIRLKSQGKDQWVFLKRQKKHLSRSIRHPLGIPTLKKEFENIKNFDHAGIDTLVPVAFGVRGRCSILMTEALSNYIALSDLTEYVQKGGVISKTLKLSIIEAVVNLVRLSHDKALLHNSLYPKHIFIKAQISNGHLVCDKYPHVRYIDLEKARSVSNRKTLIYRDLDTLNRRTPFWSDSDRMFFYKRYLKQDSLDVAGKLIAKVLAEKARQHRVRLGSLVRTNSPFTKICVTTKGNG